MAKRWFITGASSGMGREIADIALAAGDRVVATARRPENLDDLVASYGDAVTIERLDVTNDANVTQVLEKTLAAGAVDVLVNNAGGGLIGATEEMTDAEVADQLALNLIAPIRITRAFLKPMREQGGGRIIQMSSMGGQMSFPVSSPYHAAKWGLEGFSESVAQEMAGFGVFITIVQPGATRTNFQSGLKWTTELAAYKDTVVGQTRRWIEGADASTFTGDPRKLAQAVFDTTRADHPPLRLTLGADAFEMVSGALAERLAALKGQETLARSVAYND